MLKSIIRPLYSKLNYSNINRNNINIIKYLFTGQKKASTKSKIPIQTVTQLITSKQSQQIPNFNKTQYQPCEIFLFAVKSIKLNFYQQPQFEQKIMHNLQKYKDNLQYIKLFIYLILPIDQIFPRLNQFYKDIAIKYLKSSQQMYKQQPFLILQNLQRMITEVRSQWTDQKWIINDYSKQQQIANLLVPKLMQNWKQFDVVKVVRICNTLGVRNQQLGQFLLQNIKSQSCRLKMKQIISVLYYLSNMDVFPYQYFYQNKRRFVKTLQSYNIFSTKKALQSIKLLQLITLQNPMHCQKILKRIQDILLEAVPSFDNEDIANIWYICNRAKFGIYIELIQKLLDKIQAFVGSMKTRELCLVVRGFMDFRMINDYGNRIQIILKVMKQKLDKSRAYQHEVLSIMISKFENKKKKIQICSL